MIEQGTSLTRRKLLRLAAVAGLVVVRLPRPSRITGPRRPPAAEVLQRLLEAISAS